MPVGAAGIVLAWLLVPRSRHLTGRTRFDWTGLAVFLPAVTALLLAVSYGQHYGWGSPVILGLFAATIMGGVGFVIRERRASAPMLDLALFSRLPFSAGIASGLLSYLVLFGTLTVVPFFLEVARHDTSGTAGLELLVLPVGLGVTAPIAGRLAERVGARPLTVAGMLAAAVMLAASTVVHAQIGLLLAALAVAGIGLGAFTPPNNAAIMGAAPPALAGLASGVLNMTRGLGTSLGLALAGLAYTIGAGAGVATPSAATTGYRDAALFLAAVSLLAAGIAAVRGNSALNSDPTLTAE